MSKLIKCPDCGKEMSENALTCPHCGSSAHGIKMVMLGILIAIIILVIALGASKNLCSPGISYRGTLSMNWSGWCQLYRKVFD